MSSRVFLSLGSNIGDRREYLLFALNRLAHHAQICISKISSIYQTDPWGLSEQEDFYNAVVEISTELSPKELLAYTQSIENETGREHLLRWGPRQLDIDILLFDQLILDDEDLYLPHPRLSQRMFVLQPLAEINEDIVIPGIGELDKIIKACDNSQRIERLDEAKGWGGECLDENHQ